MENFELPDIGLIPCIFEPPGLGTRCGAGVMLTGVERGPELVLAIRCELGHEVNGTLLGLFSWWDLVKPALFFLEAEDFRELERMVEGYRMFVTMAAANLRPVNTAVHDQALRKWAARHPIVPREVWTIAREHWDAFDKPHHPDRSVGWVPSVFRPEDWA